MAGVETISAIIGIADFGLRLSGAISDYISTAHDAASGIKHTANDVKTTSERLNDVGQLIKHQNESKLFSDEGLQSAFRSSGECKEVLNQIRYILCKNKFIHDYSQFEKEDLDVTYFTKIKWPFVKSKLEVPRAELQRIKTDLVLLFTSVMAIGAMTQAEQRFYCMEIPKAEKIRQQAARKAEKARKRAERRESQQVYPSRRSSTISDEDDLKLKADFEAYKAQLAKEDVERRVKQHLAVLEAEEEAKRKAAEEERLKIEAQGVEKYKEKVRIEQEEREARLLATKEAFRTELLKQNFPPEQVRSILANMQLQNNPNFDPAVPITAESDTMTAGVFSSWNAARQNNSNNSRIKLPWKRNKHKSPLPLDLESDSSGFLHNSTSSNWGNGISLETWVLDNSTFAWQIYSQENSVLKQEDHNKSSRKLWETYSQLSTHFRGAFQSFYAEKRQATEGKYLWFMLAIHPIKITRKHGFFRRVEEDIGLRVLMARKDVQPQSFQASNDQEKVHDETNEAREGAKSAVAAKSTPFIAAQGSSITAQANTNAPTSRNAPTPAVAQRPDDNLHSRRRSAPLRRSTSPGRPQESIRVGPIRHRRQRSSDDSSTDEDMIYSRNRTRQRNRKYSDFESELEDIRADYRRLADRIRDREAADRYITTDEGPIRRETRTSGRPTRSFDRSPPASYRPRTRIARSPSPPRGGRRYGLERPTTPPQRTYRRHSTFVGTNYDDDWTYGRFYPPARKGSMYRERNIIDHSNKPYVHVHDPRVRNGEVIEPITVINSSNRAQPQTYTEGASYSETQPRTYTETLAMPASMPATYEEIAPRTYNTTVARRRRSPIRSSLSPPRRRSPSPPKTDTAIIVSMLNKYTSYKNSGLPPAMQLPPYPAPPTTMAGEGSAMPSGSGPQGAEDDHDVKGKALAPKDLVEKEAKAKGKIVTLDSADDETDFESKIFESPTSIDRGRRKGTANDDDESDSKSLDIGVPEKKKSGSTEEDRDARVSRGMTWARSIAEEKESITSSGVQENQAKDCANEEPSGINGKKNDDKKAEPPGGTTV